MNTDIAAETKIDTAIMILLRNSPFYGHVIVQMGRVEVEESIVSNMAVKFRTGIPVLLWCRKFIDQLDIKPLVFYVTHEIEHLVRLHPILLFKLTQKYSIDPKRASYLAIKAMHFAMNPDIDKEMRAIGIPTPDYYKSEFPSANGHEEGRATEWYFDEMVKSHRQDDINSLKDLQQFLDGHTWNNAEVTKATDDPENQTDGINWQGKPLSELDMSNIKGQIQEIVNKAVSKSRGLVPRHMQSLIEEINDDPKIPWQTHLKKFVMSKAGEVKRPTYLRPSKRWGDMVRGRVRSRKRYILVVADSSGSVPDKTFADFIAECKGMSSEYTQIWIMECDAAIQSITEINRFKPIKKWTVSGRGGTSFEPPFRFAYGIKESNDYATTEVQEKCEQLLKKVVKFDGIVYLTDGGAPHPALPQRIPTIWATTSENPFLWGAVIDMKPTALGLA